MKKLFETLELRQKKRKSFYKSEEYSFYISHRIVLNSYSRFSHLGSSSDEFNIMRANIILHGLLNKEQIENEMKNFADYFAKYGEISHDKLVASLKEKLVDLPHYQADKCLVYMPFFSRNINNLYVKEPEKLLVPPYKDLKDSFEGSFIDPFDTYGPELFYSTFTRLIRAGTNGKEVAYFHYDTNTIYIVNSQGRLDCKIVLFDKYIKRPNYNHMLERIYPVITAYFNNDRAELINSLYKQKLISARILYLIHKKEKSL